MPKLKSELKSRLRLLEIIKRNTDAEHTLTQDKLRKLPGASDAMGYKATFNRRLYEIAEAYNTDENGELLPESDWKIVFSGYVKSKKNPDEKGIHNGKIYYNHTFSKAEVDFLIHQVRATKLLCESEKIELENKILKNLTSRHYLYDEKVLNKEIVYDFGGTYSQDLSNKLNFLKHSIRNRQMVSFNVTKVNEKGKYVNNSVKPYLVSPYRIVHYNGLYFLLGNCQRDYITQNQIKFSSKISAYRIDLMDNLKRAKERNYKPARFPYKTLDTVSEWDKQVCFSHKAEIVNICEISFKVIWNKFPKRQREDYTFIYDTFGKVMRVRDEVVSVKTSVEFFSEWAMKYADKISLVNNDDASLEINKEIKKRLETALKNFK